MFFLSLNFQQHLQETSEKVLNKLLQVTGEIASTAKALTNCHLPSPMSPTIISYSIQPSTDKRPWGSSINEVRKLLDPHLSCLQFTQFNRTVMTTKCGISISLSADVTYGCSLQINQPTACEQLLPCSLSMTMVATAAELPSYTQSVL